MRIAPWHQNNWDWRAAANFMGGGAGTGLMFFALFATESPATVANSASHIPPARSPGFTGTMDAAFACII